MGIRDILSKIKDKTKKIKTEAAAVFIAYTEYKLPWYAKLTAAVVLAYALSPIDLIPDFIPIIGYLDDVILLPLGIMLTVKLIPKDIWRECLLKADSGEYKKLPKKYFAAVVIILLWTLLIVLIAYKIIKKID